MQNALQEFKTWLGRAEERTGEAATTNNKTEP